MSICKRMSNSSLDPSLRPGEIQNDKIPVFNKNDSEEDHVNMTKLTKFTLSVMMPQRSALESVSNAASTRRVAIRRHASATVVPSGMVRAFDSLKRFTVRSPGGLYEQTR